MKQTKIRHFELRESAHNKFWEMTWDGGKSYTVRFGSIGTKGRASNKTFSSAARAKEAANSLMLSKVRKGYVYLPAQGFNPPQTISAQEARRRFPVKRYELHSEYDTAVRLYSGSTCLPEVDLDGETDIIVDGDLTVAGDVVNMDSDIGAYLLVLGDLHARNLIGGGSNIAVSGSVTLENTMYGHYNHGSIDVRGDVTARAVICDDHAIGIKGKTEAVTVSWRGSMTAEFEGDDIDRILVQEVVDDGTINDRRMFDHLAANRSPLLEGVVPSRELTRRGLETMGKAVVTLDLKGKGLRKFPKEVLSMEHLEELVLEDNEITNGVPPGITKLTKLRALNLRAYSKSGSRTSLPPNFGEMHALESLNLHYNKIAIPPSVAEIHTLKSLKFGVYKQQKLPAELTRIPALEELQIWTFGGYYPEEFPPFALEFPTLRSLEVSGFRTRVIPEALGSLTGLESLDPGSLEDLDSFPDLGGLQRLKTLRFDGSSGAKKSLLDAIMHLSWIEDLDLGRWHLESLPDGLQNFTDLRVLRLAFNELPALPDWVLERPLTLLDVRYNPFSAREQKRIARALPDTEIRF